MSLIMILHVNGSEDYLIRSVTFMRIDNAARY